ncbi:MAG TPA: V-type ATP synthase subunit E [Bacillota bacterium]|nr:V-type ATP synthase subunit E [Bacillota bacterium]
MSDLRALTDSILTRARAEAEAIIEEANKESARIIAEAEEKAKSRREAITEEYRLKAEDMERRHQIGMELEARKRLLDTKHRLIRETFHQALKSLKDLPAEKRIRFLAEKLAEAGLHGGGEVRGSGSPAEWASIVKAANEIIARTGSDYQLVLSNEAPTFEGGFELVAPGYTINGSFEALIEAAEESLIPEIAGYLFDDRKG